jgi:hypothetical protein
MTVCAHINLSTGLVENMIVAEETCPVEADYLLKANPPSWVDIGTPWDGNDFVPPPDPDPIRYDATPTGSAAKMRLA